jgi:exodeoxyribonuclease VII large subunit
MIRSVINSSFSQTYWVKAEIAKLNYQTQTNRCFPELIEKADNSIKAKINGVIWENDFHRINKLFTEVARQSLKDGMSVLFEAKVRYGPIYGLQLQIINIDPAFTLGVLAMEKQKSIEQLKSEGIFSKNKEVAFPLLPKSLAIISAETGKGFSDFMSIINAYASKYRILYKLFPAALQGDSAVSSITHQLNAISHNIHQYDAVLIIRGGGDELDLNCYNNFRLAREVALFPIPVITGIGHSTNDTVVEMVAHHSNITPTDVAYFILGHFVAYENRVVEAQSRLSFIVEKLLISENQRINELVRAVKSGSMPFIRQHAAVLNSFLTTLTKNARKHLDNNVQLLSAFVMKLSAGRKFNLTQAIAQLKLYDEKITILNPENVLKRGYSITTINGKLIKDVSMLKSDDTISTELSSGIIKSKVEKIIQTKDGQ